MWKDLDEMEEIAPGIRHLYWQVFRFVPHWENMTWDINVDVESNQVQLGAQGRLVIPAALRKALNLKPGDQLVVRKVGDSLVLERRETIEKRLWEMFSQIPKEVSLVDELIAERRVEAQHENTA